MTDNKSPDKRQALQTALLQVRDRQSKLAYRIAKRKGEINRLSAEQAALKRERVVWDGIGKDLEKLLESR